VGGYRISFPEHAPYTTVKNLVLRAAFKEEGREVRRRFSGKYPYKMEDESWAVHVPRDYDPDVPLGLLVFVSAGNGASMGYWVKAVEGHQMIFVSPLKAGNSESPVGRRMPLALDAVYNLGGIYSIDPERIYISGFSGGGRLASRLAIAFPDIFTGGIFMCGCNYYRTHELDGGRYWPPGISLNSRSLFNKARVNSRLVFLTGSKDSNQDQTKVYQKRFRGDGFKHTVYVEVPGMGHSSAPPEKYMTGSLEWLDKSLIEGSDNLYRRALAQAEGGKFGEALRSVGLAIGRGRDRDFVPEARRKLIEWRNKYAEELNKLVAAHEAEKLQMTSPALVEFRKTWLPYCKDDVGKLLAGSDVDAPRKQDLPPDPEGNEDEPDRESEPEDEGDDGPAPKSDTPPDSQPDEAQDDSGNKAEPTDKVYLYGGRVIEGKVVESPNASIVVIETAVGTVRLRASQVKKIVRAEAQNEDDDTDE
jgi:predicted esterase